MKMSQFTEAIGKNRNVPNADDRRKQRETTINPMGHEEETTYDPGEPVKRVLNELDPDEQETETQLESRGLQMSRQINETVQDQKGVSGDFMEPMGGKTNKLGASQKNTGGAYEQCCDSSSGSPDDGIQTRMKGENLLGQGQKNTGGTFEEFGQSKSVSPDDQVQDQCCDMAYDLGQNEKQKNKGGQHETFEGGGSYSMSEGWSIDDVLGTMEEEDVNLQALFDTYAAQTDLVCLEEFQQICDAHDVQTVIGEDNLRALMNLNKEFMFYESDDEHGTFWMRGQIEEGLGSAIASSASDAIDDVFGDEEEPEEEFGECMISGDVETDFETDFEPGVEPGWLPDGPRSMRRPEIDPRSEIQPDEPRFPRRPGSRSSRSIRGPGGPGGPRSPFEDVSDGDNVIQETVGTAGIAAPPGVEPEEMGLGRQIKAGKLGERRKTSAVGTGEEESEEIKPGRQPMEGICPRCNSLMDNLGCPACDLLHETIEGGISTSSKSGSGRLRESVPGAETQESSSGSPDTGCCTEMGMGKQLGENEKVKNKGGQAAFKGGGAKMQENVMRLARVAKKSIEESAKQIGRIGKYGIRFAVFCEGVKARMHGQLTEALVDVEELMQAYGPKNVQLEARFYQPQGHLISKATVQLANIAKRDPIVSEGRVLFRFPEVANDFADRVVSEGLACKVKNHNWGNAVSGHFDWNTARQAFKDIPSSMIGEGRTPRPFCRLTEAELTTKKREALPEASFVFPADHDSVTDGNDHFPIHDEAHARNALSRANQYSSAPSWYSGSLSDLVSTVARVVRNRYPGIEVSGKSGQPGKNGD